MWKELSALYLFIYFNELDIYLIQVTGWMFEFVLGALTVLI